MHHTLTLSAPWTSRPEDLYSTVSGLNGGNPGKAVVIVDATRNNFKMEFPELVGNGNGRFFSAGGSRDGLSIYALQEKILQNPGVDLGVSPPLNEGSQKLLMYVCEQHRRSTTSALERAFVQMESVISE